MEGVPGGRMNQSEINGALQSEIAAVDGRLTYRHMITNIAERAFTYPVERTVTTSSSSAALWNASSLTFPVTAGKFYGVFVRIRTLDGNTATVGNYRLQLYRDNGTTPITKTDVWESQAAVGGNAGTYVNLFRVVMAGETRQKASVRMFNQSGSSESRTHHFEAVYLWIIEGDTLDDIVYFQRYYTSKATPQSITVINDFTKQCIAMSSAGGIGFDVTEYLPESEWVNIDAKRFEYCCRLYQTNGFRLTGSMYEKWVGNSDLGYFPMFDMTEVTSIVRMVQACQQLRCFPNMTFNNLSVNTVELFAQCRMIRRIGNLTGLTSTDPNKMFQNFNCLRRVGKLKFSANSNGMNMFYNDYMLERLDEIDATAGFVVKLQTSGYHWMRTAHPFLRYCLIKGLGTAESQTTFNCSSTMAVWGVSSDGIPDARQSLVDSLLTYSYDRAAAGYDNCNVSLSAASMAVLTEEEKTDITAKGYILVTA